MTVTPYALMLADPCTEVMIVWLDARVGADGSPQTLHYGSGQTIEATGTALYTTGIWRYHATLTGLTPGALVPLSIPAISQTFLPVKMLPSSVPPAGVLGLSVSDVHARKRQVTSPATIAHVVAVQPDFVYSMGDMFGEFDTSQTNANHINVWHECWRDYYSQWNKTYLPQIFYAPGNHDVGNNRSNGTNGATTGVTNPVFDWFFPDRPPNRTGPRHKASKAGNWLQLLGGDVFTNTVASADAFLRANHDPSVTHCIWGTHSPSFSSPDMRNLPEDPTLQQLQREAWFDFVAAAENMRFGFGGNIHVDTETRWLGLSASDPGAVNKLEVAGKGWVVEAPTDGPGYREYGQGCIGGRAGTMGQWYFQREHRDNLNCYRMHFTPSSVTVENWNAGGMASSTIYGDSAEPSILDHIGRAIQVFDHLGRQVSLQG